MNTNQWAVKMDNEVYPFNDAKKITCIENNGMEILFEGIVEGCSVWGKYPGTDNKKMKEMAHILSEFVACANKYCKPWNEK